MKTPFAPFYFATVGFEGCPHKHRALGPAMDCAAKLGRLKSRGAVRVYRVNSSRPFNPKLIRELR